jgi:hypothetical protein
VAKNKIKTNNNRREQTPNLKGDIHFRVGASQSNEVTDTEKHIQSKFGKFT